MNEPDLSPQLGREFILPDKVALIDIDGTLVDKSYQVTDDRIYDAIRDAQDNGWTIGLSSDSPYETMQDWRSHFGMNGPIIAEKGAYVVHGEYAAGTSNAPFDFVALRDSFLDRFQDTGTVVLECEPVSFLKSGERIGSPGDSVLLANKHRRHSVGFFSRMVDKEGNLVLDQSLTESHVGHMRSLYPTDLTFDEDINHDHGLMIVSHEGMHKRIGTLELCRVMRIGRIAMIGNSIADFVQSDIALQFAVGDSTPEYKAVADYVASKHITAGVIEALGVLVAHGR